jgi:dTDP-glucose pyrophosphorylase
MTHQLEYLTDLGPYRIAPDAPIRVAMERLSSAPVLFKFQVVCDRAGRLLGTVTDGDVRRAILRGIGIGDPVVRCMKENPVVGRFDVAGDYTGSLNNVPSPTTFLPLVDGHGMLRSVVVRSGDRPATTALLMAGGLGTRLGARTRDRPKPLLPVGDKPILAHLLDRIEAANTTQVFISVCYLADQIRDFVSGRRNSAKIELLHEADPLGTAGAIGMLPDPMPGPFMVINGDILTQLDFHAFHEFHARHKYDATVAVAQHEVTVPYGVVRTGPDGQFQGIDEKPTLTHFVAAGIYLLSPEFRALVHKGERLDMPRLLDRGRAIGLRTGLFPIHEYWTDVGRPEDLETAQRAQLPPSLIPTS